MQQTTYQWLLHITCIIAARLINLLSIVVTEALRVAASVSGWSRLASHWSRLASHCPSKQSERWCTHPTTYTADMALLSLFSAFTVLQWHNETEGPRAHSIATEIHAIVAHDSTFLWHGHTTRTTTATVTLMLRNVMYRHTYMYSWLAKGQCLFAQHLTIYSIDYRYTASVKCIWAYLLGSTL